MSSRSFEKPAAKKIIPAMLADTDFLFRQAKLGSDAFTQAQPFPHLLLPSFIKPACCFALFEGLTIEGLELEGSGMEGMLSLVGQSLVHESIVRMLLWELSSSTLIRHFTSLAGKPPLLPDPFLIHSGVQHFAQQEIVHRAEKEYFARHPETQLQNVLRVELFASSEAHATFTIDVMDTPGHVGVSHTATNGAVWFVNSDDYYLRYRFEHPAQWRSLMAYYYINDNARNLHGEEQPDAGY